MKEMKEKLILGLTAVNTSLSVVIVILALVVLGR